MDGTTTWAVSKCELGGHTSELPMWACLVMDIGTCKALVMVTADRSSPPECGMDLRSTVMST